ncbi:MAG: glycosyltransferase [Helicobacter sp.]|nr:glycosyltransferase [Helicobacter sp.]
MNSPKILQLGKFYPPHIGGIESLMQDLSQALAQNNFDVFVLCSNKAPILPNYENPMPNLKIKRTKSLGIIAKTSISPQMIFDLTKNLKKIDVIHLHMPDPMATLALFIACTFISNKKRPKIILHWHSDIIKQKFLLKLFLPLQHWALKNADAIIATSQNYINTSPQLAHFRHKCCVIPIGIDDIANPQTSPTPKTRNSRNRILSVGRLGENKGFKYLIDAMKLLIDYELEIIGSGEEYAALDAQIKANNLQNRVFLSGAKNRDEIAKCYKNANYFVLASLQESYGIVLVEALCFGLPIICTNLALSGSSFINQHKMTGLLVDPKNSTQIANAIIEISQNYDFYAKNARARFGELFTKDKMIDKTIALYQDLLNL